MNKSDQTTISKNCSSCGLQKPLSAFLQITGPEGATYGHICSACHKTNLSKPKTPISDGEGSTTSETDNRIGAEERIFDAAEKKKQFEETSELYRKEEEKDELISTIQIDKVNKIAKGEKDHRESYLQKRPFLSGHEKKKSPSEEQVFGGTEHAAIEGKIDFSAPFIDTMIVGKEKHKSAIFNQFKSWLGTGTPVGSTVKKTEISSQKNNKEHTEKESLAKIVEDTWGPKSRGR